MKYCKRKPIIDYSQDIIIKVAPSKGHIICTVVYISPCLHVHRQRHTPQSRILIGYTRSPQAPSPQARACHQHGISEHHDSCIIVYMCMVQSWRALSRRHNTAEVSRTRVHDSKLVIHNKISQITIGNY